MFELYVEDFADVTAGVICENEEVYGSNFGVNSRELLASLKRMLPSEASFDVLSKPSELSRKAANVIRDIYEGKGANEVLSLALDRFPIYRRRVLKTVYQIPVGYVASYGGVAEAAGGGARAVGNAMATNCFAPIVPCHRVVTSSLGLGGYGGGGGCGGLKVKYDFLVREKRGFKASREVLVDGRVMKVFPVEFVLKNLERSVFARMQRLSLS